MTAYPGGPEMHKLVAEQLGAQVTTHTGPITAGVTCVDVLTALPVQVLTVGCREDDVVSFLKKVPVKLGKGKVSVSLEEVLPSICVQDIVRACEEFERSA
jgi:hypothetical protein